MFHLESLAALRHGAIIMKYTNKSLKVILTLHYDDAVNLKPIGCNTLEESKEGMHTRQQLYPIKQTYIPKKNIPSNNLKNGNDKR